MFRNPYKTIQTLRDRLDDASASISGQHDLIQRQAATISEQAAALADRGRKLSAALRDVQRLEESVSELKACNDRLEELSSASLWAIPFWLLVLLCVYAVLNYDLAWVNAALVSATSAIYAVIPFIWMVPFLVLVIALLSWFAGGLVPEFLRRVGR